MTLVSIVLPVHNGSRYLDEAVASVARQTLTDWELILVDDASTDESPALIEAWTAADARISAVHLAENRKLPAALNEGFRRATGVYWTWTSDDNVYAPEALGRMAAVLESRPDVDVVYTDYTLIDAAGAALRVERALEPRDLTVKNAVGACFLHRRHVYERLGGYDEGLFLAEDYDFWMRASLEFRLEPLHEPLYYYRVHERSLSAEQAGIISRVTEPAIERWLAAAKWLTRRDQGRAWEAMGERALVRGDLGAARRHLLRAAWLLRRPPVFHECRSYAIDLFVGRRAGERLRAWRGRRQG